MMISLMLSLLLWQDPASEVSEEISVIYRQMKIRVQDKHGMPIKGLGGSDFAIKLNGEVFAPESFQEVDFMPGPGETLVDDIETGRAASAASATAPEAEPMPEMARTITILLDTGIATPTAFDTLKKNIDTFLGTLRPNDVIALYAIENDLKPVTPFTADKNTIREGLAEIRFMPTLWQRMETAQRSINDTVGKLMSPRLLNQRQSRGAAAGQQNPASQSERMAKQAWYGEINSNVKMKRRFKDAHAMRVAAALEAMGRSLKPRSGERSVYLFTSGGYMDETNVLHLKKVTGRLNWENITVHSFQLRSRDSADLSMTKLAKITVTDLADYQSRLAQAGFVQPRSGNNGLAENESELKSQPRTYAHETGGTFVSAFNKLQTEIQLQRFAAASSHYYLVSYKPKAKFDSFKVRLRKPLEGASVYYGSSRGRNQVYEGLSEEDKKTDFANTLLYGHETSETPCDWQGHAFKSAEGYHTFPILGQLEGSFPEEGYILGLVALDRDDQVLDERKSEITKPGRDHRLTFYDLLVTDEPPARVRAMIREKKSGATNLYEFVPQAVDEGPWLSTIALIPAKAHKVFAIHALQNEKVKLGKKKVARKTLDPLVIAENQMISLSMGPFEPGKNLGLYFKVQDLADDIGNYVFESYLTHGETRTALPFNIAKISPETGGLRVMAALVVANLPEGDYELGLCLKNKHTGKRSNYSKQRFAIGKATASF